MQRTCTKCGGYLFGELTLDLYQVKYWKCVNCGWSREETLVRPSRAISPVRHQGCR